MTPNIPGQLLVLFAFALNVVAGIAFFRVATGHLNARPLALRAYRLFTAMAVLASAYLFYLFFAGEYSVAYVYGYSDSSLSWLYVLSAFWGGQEGTYLLWLTLSAFFGFIIIKRGGQYTNWAMVIFTAVNLFFLLLLVKLSPFALMSRPVTDGAGLNPLLQDPWMVIHPPIVFVGYAMSGVPFSIAMAALIINDYSGWVKRAFPWVAVTALMLAAGNILGGYWAYKTLGWGGFWAWDPVENSSFIPWFASLALLHGLIIQRRSGALAKTNILMTAYVFLLVVYGTFLTRSGVLADFSVHSFVDLGVNGLLVGFMVFYIILTLALFVPRIRYIDSVPLEYNLFNKEFAAFLGMLLLFVFTAVVLFWTSLPILTTYFTNEPRAANISTYNQFAIPFAIIYSLLLAVAPYQTFQGFMPPKWVAKLAVAAISSFALGFGVFYVALGADLTFVVLFTVVVTTIVMFLQKSDLRKQLMAPIAAFILAVVIGLLLRVYNVMHLLFFATAAMAIVANLVAIFGYFPTRLRIAGAHIVHLGFGVMIVGILASAAYTTNAKLVIPRGDNGAAYGYTVSYKGMAHDITFPKNELILAVDHGSSTEEARPQLYYSERMQGFMKKPFIERRLLYDLYMSPEQVVEAEKSSDIVLTKDEPRKVDGYTMTFLGYEIGDHSNGTGMRVTARIRAEKDGKTEVITPAVETATGSTDPNSVTNVPATLGADTSLIVNIGQILADQHAVALDIPGLTESGTPEKLVLDIAYKPIINLVWLGTTLLLVGGLIVFFRRNSEI